MVLVKRKEQVYTVKNYKTKKALKEDVAAGKQVEVYDTAFINPQSTVNGNVTLEGPHYPEPHKWYAQATVKDNIIVSVK
jgi:hypothetical protein